MGPMAIDSSVVDRDEEQTGSGATVSERPVTAEATVAESRAYPDVDPEATSVMVEPPVAPPPIAVPRVPTIPLRTG